MAKSTRSKVKRAYRARKRTDGVYAAIEAARLERLSSKLRAVRDADNEGDIELADLEAKSDVGAVDSTAPEDTSPETPLNPDSMELDKSEATKPVKKISTHGRRVSRRTEWRVSKGLPPRPKSRGMNRKGGVAAKSRAGRAHRRR